MNTDKHGSEIAFRSGRKALARDLLHEVAEAVEFPEGRIDVGRDPDAFELLVDDGRRKDVVLVKEVSADRPRVGAHYFHIRDGARLLRIERRVETNLRH